MGTRAHPQQELEIDITGEIQAELIELAETSPLQLLDRAFPVLTLDLRY